MKLTLKRALPTIALIVLLVGGAAIRIGIASRAVAFGDDYGTAALMSKHILEGREFPLYFYGYRYIGALGAYVGALAFALFGQSLFSLCLAMIPFSSLWIFATFLLFRRLIGAWAGVIAAAVVAFPPPVVMGYSTVPLLGYPPTFALGTLLLYFGVRLNDGDLSSRAEWLCLLGMAVCAGLALWTNPMSVPYLLVAFGLLVAHVVRARFRPALLVKLGVASVLLVAALLPAIVTALDYGLGDMFGHWPVGVRFIPRSFWVVVTQYVPDQLLGLDAVHPAVAWGVGALYGVLGLGFAVGLTQAIRRRDGRLLRAAAVPVVFVVVFLLLFLPNSVAPSGLWRYFIPFYLVVITCIVFPFAYRRTWLTAAAVMIAAVLLAYNLTRALTVVRVGDGYGAAETNARIDELVEAAKASGLRHIMIQNYHGLAMTFVADEQVIFSRTTKGRYYPHIVSAAADDRAGFAKRDHSAYVFAQTLEALGITSWKTFSAGGWTVFHDIALPAGRLRLVEPTGAAFIKADGTRSDAAALIDRNDDTIAGREFAAGTCLVVDLGGPTEIAAARFVAPDPGDYPVAYTFSGSDDGEEWTEIQRVENRDALTCICGNRLDHEGRFTAMECRFEPTTLRYLKMSDVRPAAEQLKIWRFQEVYLYAPAHDEHTEEPPLAARRSPTGGGRPDDAEAVAIARELGPLGLTLVIADEWLSRRIELSPEPHPRVWPRWEFRFPKTQFARIVPLEPGVAVVVESAHAEAVGKRLADTTLGDVALSRHDFPHYAAFVVENAPPEYAAFPGLRWNGFTVVATARIATADWYHRHGTRLERARRTEDAMRYYRRSYETFSGIRANLERLADDDQMARAALALLTPEHDTYVRFPHGVSLVGYTLTPSTLVPGRPATLRLVWQVEGEVKHNFMQVFVHFLDGEQRIFQADHNAVFPLTPGSTVPAALVLDEHVFNVPPDVPAGELAIELGATSVADRSIRLNPRTELPTRHRAVEIGRVQVRPAQGAD